jgi:signal transduction histidine kinase
MSTERKRFHKILERQLSKTLGRQAEVPDWLLPLLEQVSESYQHSDEDRAMLERSIELSSQELLQANRGLKQQQRELEEAVEELRSTQQELLHTQEMAALSRQLQEANGVLEQQKEELEAAYQQLGEAQSQLVHAEKMSSLGQLTAGIAHEINNPVNFVYAGTQALKITVQELFLLIEQYYKSIYRDPSSITREDILKYKDEIFELKADVWEMINSVQAGAERTAAIVTGLRTFARADAEDTQFCQLSDLIEATLVVLGSELSKGVEVRRDYASLPEVPCYPGQLNQVFMNVLANAIQAMDHRGTLDIATSDADTHIEISIRDSGPGIPPAVLSRIFDPFYTTKEVGKGTGLGLSISYGIIEKHRGRIWAESKEGEGACFRIALPKYLAQDRA